MMRAAPTSLPENLAKNLPKHLLFALTAAAALGACKRPDTETSTAQATATTPPSHVAAAFSFKDTLDAADFGEHVRILASDEFEGRAPGTIGEEKTVEYLKAQFERMGLKPGNGDSFFQTVPMMETTADETTTMTLDVGGKAHTLKFGSDMVIGTRTGQPEVKIDASDLVFVGYGVDAPEQKWNDYAGLDVKGKTVVMFVNDPGFHAKDASLFEGKRMTYYGRWTYKFEEAGRKGAAAALIIHDTEGASYGWDVVKNSWSGAQYDLRAADDPAPRVPLQGWITGEQAKAIFADAGLDIDQMRAAANKRGFKPVSLKAKMSITLKSTTAEKESRNVLALLPGSERPNEAIVYMAHWDHLGNHIGEKNPDGSGDVIYNGAVDNGTGVAGILELAEQFAKIGKPKRSILFAAVTLEESGLLGSKYYVAHPTIPLANTVAVVNLDALGVAGRARDITVIGKGNSELEDILKPIVEKQGRTMSEESNPAGGYYFRSDHFNFAKVGVPALYPDSGNNLVEGGTAAGDAAGKDYNEKRYHKPDDEYDPATWKLDGVMQDLQAVYAVGDVLANNGAWPNWYAGNPFRAARDAMMAKKAEDAGAATAAK
jgi:Zn-dependent M28 family amino/carboxypeptidase